MSANWFVALPVTAEPWFARVGDPPPGVRLFHPEDLHLTVAFLGAVGEAPARAAFVAAAAFRLESRAITLGPVVPMGNARRPSALSARLVEGDRELAQAITDVRDAICDAADAKRELRPALPHLTVARPRRSATYGERAAAVRWAATIDLGAPKLELDAVALYTWSETRGTRLFTIVDRIAL